MNKTAVHFVDKYLLNPTNPIKVNLIGAGGTGSQILTALVRIHTSLLALEHAGLTVHVFDNDTVSKANLGRQLFTEQEIGLPKAVALINRVNRFCGTNWKAITKLYNQENVAGNPAYHATITISCVDTIAARFGIADILRQAATNSGRDRPLYWLDLGNGKDTGQAVLATVGKIKQPASKKYKAVESLPFITDEYKDLLLSQQPMEKNTPSCSLAEALQQQDLFINTAVAAFSDSLLWSMFRKGMLEYKGFFMNLNTYQTQPIKVA